MASVPPGYVFVGRSRDSLNWPRTARIRILRRVGDGWAGFVAPFQALSTASCDTIFRMKRFLILALKVAVLAVLITIIFYAVDWRDSYSKVSAQG